MNSVPPDCLDNKALNRSVLSSRVGKSPDARFAPIVSDFIFTTSAHIVRSVNAGVIHTMPELNTILYGAVGSTAAVVMLWTCKATARLFQQTRTFLRTFPSSVADKITEATRVKSRTAAFANAEHELTIAQFLSLHSLIIRLVPLIVASTDFNLAPPESFVNQRALRLEWCSLAVS